MHHLLVDIEVEFDATDAEQDGGEQDEDLHDLISERYEQTATIVTSNLDFAEWGEAFPNKLLGAATLDRLRDNAYRLILEGESYRTPRPMPSGKKGTVATGQKTGK